MSVSQHPRTSQGLIKKLNYLKKRNYQGNYQGFKLLSIIACYNSALAVNCKGFFMPIICANCIILLFIFVQYLIKKIEIVLDISPIGWYNSINR